MSKRRGDELEDPRDLQRQTTETEVLKREVEGTLEFVETHRDHVESVNAFVDAFGDGPVPQLKSNEAEDDQKMTDYPSPQRMVEISDEFFTDNLELTKAFGGWYSIQWGWLWWLQNNLPGDVFCIYATYGEEIEYPIRVEEKTPRGENADFLTITEDFLTSYKRCLSKGYRFIIGILGLPEHSNALIFDTQHKVLTRFEPQGAETEYWRGDTDDDIDEILSDLYTGTFVVGKTFASDGREPTDDEIDLFIDFKYNAPVDYCPPIGPQTLESRYGSTKERFEWEKGYCAAWSVIFLHFRVLNPEMDDATAVRYFTSKPAPELLSMIRGYAATIASYQSIYMPLHKFLPAGTMVFTYDRHPGYITTRWNRIDDPVYTVLTIDGPLVLVSNQHEPFVVPHENELYRKFGTLDSLLKGLYPSEKVRQQVKEAFDEAKIYGIADLIRDLMSEYPKFDDNLQAWQSWEIVNFFKLFRFPDFDRLVEIFDVSPKEIWYFLVSNEIEHSRVFLRYINEIDRWMPFTGPAKLKMAEFLWKNKITSKTAFLKLTEDQLSEKGMSVGIRLKVRKWKRDQSAFLLLNA